MSDAIRQSTGNDFFSPDDPDIGINQGMDTNVATGNEASNDTSFSKYSKKEYEISRELTQAQIWAKREPSLRRESNYLRRHSNIYTGDITSILGKSYTKPERDLLSTTGYEPMPGMTTGKNSENDSLSVKAGYIKDIELAVGMGLSFTLFLFGLNTGEFIYTVLASIVAIATVAHYAD